MDLRLARRKAGDVTPTERDRYLFLETLLAARQRICMSYVARDSRTGDQLDPSSVVRELQFILRGYVNGETLDRLTIQHPLSRYDSEYFPDLPYYQPTNGRKLTSYDSEARRGAAMAALRRDLAHSCGDLPLPDRDELFYQQLDQQSREAMWPALRMVQVPLSPEARMGPAAEVSLPISALRKFLECPLQGAAQYALGIFEDDGDGLEQWQDEPVAQSILDRTSLLREVFWKARGDRQLVVSEYEKAFRISQFAGEAPAGPFARAAGRVDCANIEHWIDEAREAGCGSLDQWREIRIGRGDESAQADRVLAELTLPAREEVRGETRLRVVKIQGSLGFISAAGNGALRLVLRDEARAKDFLGPFLSAIVLAAAGEFAAADFHAIVVGARKGKSFNDIRSMRRPTMEQARSYLSDLVSDLLFGKNHYFLPIEAVDKALREIKRGGAEDLPDLINDLRDNEFAKCSSDYGPIRNARRFEPPTAEAVKRILERRFGLLRAIFAREKH
jgi:exodeoxyribonuclease V gamma subunit